MPNIKITNIIKEISSAFLVLNVLISCGIKEAEVKNTSYNSNQLYITCSAKKILQILNLKIITPHKKPGHNL